jgi:hypothetical protein
MALKRFLALLVVAGLFLLSACGDDDDSSSSDSGGSASSSETAAESTEATAVTFETTEPSKSKVSIDAPKSIDAGLVDITYKNSGKGPHDGQIVRVEGDRTAQNVIDTIVDSDEGAPIPAWLSGGGGVGTVAPGQTAKVTQVLEPGTYYLLDTESGQGGGPSNAEKGGIVKFEVTGEGGGELPSTAATITAEDYSFETSGVKPGKNRLTFENAGEELHHVIAFPINKGATIEDAKKAFMSEEEPQGPPPVDFEGFQGTAVIDGGEEQVTELDFQKGKYALVCFITDREGGPPHVAKGMVSELEVK